MRILDENNVEIQSPDLSIGRLVEEKLFVAHHDAMEAVQEQWHYETTAVYPNGGKDVAKVVDVPGVEAKDAWDEYETVQRYIPYTDEELEAMNAPSPQDDMDAMLVDHELRLTMLELGIQKRRIIYAVQNTETHDRAGKHLWDGGKAGYFLCRGQADRGGIPGAYRHAGEVSHGYQANPGAARIPGL